jgi:hypothetical protein
MLTIFLEVEGTNLEIDYAYQSAERDVTEYGMPLNKAEGEEVEICGVWVEGSNRAHSLMGMFEIGFLRDTLEKMILEERRKS